MIGILVLGAGGAVPTPTHGPPGYLVELDGLAILTDPGPGAVARLLAAERGPDSLDRLDTVLLSHLHIDHCADLVPLLFALHSPELAATGDFHLIGPVGLQDYLARLRDLYGSWLEPARRQLVVCEIEPGQGLAFSPGQRPAWQVGPPGPETSIEAFAADHPQERLADTALCFRFRDRQGHCVAFSGDSQPGDGLLAASHGADLLIVECSLPDEQALVGHMTPDRVGKLCAAAAPGRVILTHLFPAAAALDLPALVGRHFPGPVEKATDGSYFCVPAPGDEEASG